MQSLTAPWSHALEVRMQSGLKRSFTDPRDAADFLENEWPFKHGEKYERAIKTCHAAVERQVPLAVAREAFLAACLEARLEVVTRTTRH